MRRVSLDDLLTIEQVAEKLHVSLRTVREWRYRRRIPFTRVGRRLYVLSGAVEVLLAQNVIEPLGGSREQEPRGQGGEAEEKQETSA
jgi:excisionase family DNA binding protein